MEQHTFDRIARRAHTVPTHLGLRRHRQDVARWALASGHPVDRDALAAIVGARASMSDGTVTLHWTAFDVGALLWSGVATWSLEHGVGCPSKVATTLDTYLRYLSAHRLFELGSESMTVLRRAMAEHDVAEPAVPGQDLRGARSRHPAAGRGALAPVLPIS